MVRPELRMTTFPLWRICAEGTSAALKLAPAAETATSRTAVVNAMRKDNEQRPPRKALFRYDSRMTIERRAAALLFLAFTACMPNTKHEPSPAEVIYAGGTVLAGPNQTPQANWSVVTANGLIVAVGPSDAMHNAHPDAKVVDVHGTTVMPGLTDAHGHLYGLGLSLDTVNGVGAAP